MKVLIADDSAMQRQLLERHVRVWGYEAVIAKDGTEAWELLRAGDAPRLAILDWQMPGIDGIDVCRKVKVSQELPFTYIVMLTTRDADEDIVAGLDAGADDYLIKPVEPKILRSRLAAARRIVELVPPKEWSTPRVPGYQVERILGRGACASVWQAMHEQSGRTVALKLMRVDLVTGEVFDRFAREILIMQRLEHPNIARVYDSRIEKNLAFFTMELIDGITFDRYVNEKKPKAGKVLSLAAQISDALHYAHEQGVVHRDLKPSNIIITPEREPKLVDFGLARSMFRPDEQFETSESLQGAVIGTPLFMSPEQARGENESLDGRADVYALAIIIYMVLVRRHPHQINKKDRWQTIRAIAEGTALKPSEVRPKFNRNLEKILMKALAEDRAERYATAADFSVDIRRFLQELLAAHQKQTASDKK